MRFLMALSLIGLAAVAANATEGVKLGDLQISGTACQLEGVGPLPVSIEEGKLQVPAAMSVKKIASEKVSRGTCAFALPVEVDNRHRLVLSNSSIVGLINLSKGSKAQVSVELFKAGSRGQVLSKEASALKQKLRQDFELRQEGEVIELACGESAILRGNASILLQGSSRATGALHLIELDAQVEDCR